MTTKERLEKALSEIFSDKYDCKVTIKFVPRPDGAEKKEANP